MKKLLKRILPFWQEAAFIIGLGIVLAGIAGNIRVSFQHPVNIVFFCLVVILFASLVGQFFWKSKAISIALAIILGLGSFYMILAALSDLAKPDLDGMTPGGLMFGLGMFVCFCIAALTMPFKYWGNKRRKISCYS